jgi:hypothetical protein
MSSTKFVTFVRPSGGSHFAAGARAIYYPSHEACSVFHFRAAAKLCARSVFTGSYRASAASCSRAKPQSDPGQAADEELADPHHSSAANIR